jgi:ABC-type nitrate/sulfonate/bicarbonate transport system substrate-binding protein
MRRLLLIFAVVLFPAAPLAQTKIKVGTVRSTVIGGVVSAQARGYFKDAGLDVDIALIDASAAFVPALATNELNVVEGGISANLFNGVAQGLPIKIAFDSTSTPINHSLMLRYDLRNEIKSIRDLKGRTVAVNAPIRSRSTRSPVSSRAPASRSTTCKPRSYRSRRWQSRSKPRPSTRASR